VDQVIDNVIVEVAASHQLPPQVVRAMVLVESGGNPVAMRFEPGFFDRYIKDKPLNYVPAGCSRDTEAVCRATSFGLLQIMLETARCVGFRGWPGELLDPRTGLEWGCRYLRRLADRYLADGGWESVVRAYNGGPGNRHNVANSYPVCVLSHIPGCVWPD
jgi:soluble lytic murein transglycosylase-like protein